MQDLKHHQLIWSGVVCLGSSTFEELQNSVISPDYVTLCIGRQGMAVFNINFKQYALRKDDLFVLYEDTFVMLQKRSRNFIVDYIHIDKAFATDIAFVLPNSLFAFFNFQPRLSMTSAQARLFSHWYALFRYYLQERTEHRKLQLRQHLQNFFLEIANQVDHSGAIFKEERSRKAKLCWQFWALITQHCKQQRDVKFYAKQLVITPFYLSQIVKDFFNDPPKALIDRQVVLEIKAQLERGILSIQGIADELNFEDTSYLCRYFKRHTGMTLSEFRKRKRGT
ncbi:helix-turn-helix domain-containing protein [Providencia alcalifaciens]|uniref:AraC family transcriptional regulator n=1 Tax=Providencia TaxID=586 RepID=UPI0015EB3D23|nr:MULTISPECIES: helix-turn-helix domain-containing protein [Providencia]QLQ99108.1 AraC family transcriptional regulator [Providencia alcalifaciens]